MFMQRASFLKHSSIFRIGYRSGFSNSLKSYRKLQRKNENIWGTGSNEYNQLCIPSEQTLLPQRVQGLDTNESFIQIDTCVKHSIGVTDKGKFWIWGSGRLPGTVIHDEDPKKPSCPGSLSHDRVIQAAVGLEHNIILTDSPQGFRTVYACGSHEFGQCGIGGRTGEGSAVSYPHTIGFFSGLDFPVIQVAAGYDHSMALSSDGKVYTWGSGVEGQLGHGDGDCQDIPKLVEGLPDDIQSIVAGVDCSAAITLNGELYLWGSNEFNQMGINSKKKIEAEPVFIKSLQGCRVKDVALGGMHVLAIDTENNVYGWGSNKEGQLGFNERDEFIYPDIIPCLKSKNIRQISCSSYHSVCLSDLGVAYSFGLGKEGQLGLGDTGSELLATKIENLKGRVVKKVVCGWNHTLFLIEE